MSKSNTGFLSDCREGGKAGGGSASQGALPALASTPRRYHTIAGQVRPGPRARGRAAALPGPRSVRPYLLPIVSGELWLGEEPHGGLGRRPAVQLPLGRGQQGSLQQQQPRTAARHAADGEPRPAPPPAPPEPAAGPSAAPGRRREDACASPGGSVRWTYMDRVRARMHTH